MASAASSSSSFLAWRGVAEDLAAARPAACVWAPVLKLRRTGRAGFPRAALAATTPARHGGPSDKKKKRDETGMPIPLAFDPLGVREAAAGGLTSTSGGGGLCLWGGEKKEGIHTTTGRRQGDNLPPVSAEWLDRWVRSSVTEIVKRIEEAPFLSFIFANDTDGCSTSSSAVRIQREVADADDWPSIQKRWGSKAPDGVILVEELKDQTMAAAAVGDAQEYLAKDNGGGGLGSAATRTWGVLVQGRGGGPDCTACYILNTCRVRSALGCCTHFCLVRAQCYGEPAEQQFRNAWLAYGYRHWQRQ